jgi:autotransporter-associated beta strand protein
LSNSLAQTSNYTTVNIGSYLNGNLSINNQMDPVGLTGGNTGTAIPFLTSAYGPNGYMGSAFLAGNSSPATSSTLTINLASQNITGQATMYALLNNYYGTANANEYNVVLQFTNGASVTYSSIGGVNTRDYNHSSFTDSISPTTTNWWSNYAIVGSNYQRLDVREFAIPTADVNSTVASLSIVQLQPNDPGFLSGLTFSSLPPLTFVNNSTPLTLTNIVTQSGNLLSAVNTSLNPIFDGGVLTAPTDTTTNTAFAITGNGGTIDAAGKNLVFQGVLSNFTTTPGSMIFGNSGVGGEVALAAVNTYTGATTIVSGTLALTGAGSIASSSGVLDNGVLDISGASAPVDVAALTGSGGVSLGANTLNVTNATGTFSGVIGGTGGVTIAAGQQTLSGINTYTGATTINAGTLALAGAGSIASSSGVLDNGVLDISGTTAAVNVAALTGSGGVNLGANTLNVTNAAGTFAGVIGGTGGVTVAAGHQTLTGANTFSGALTVDAGAVLTIPSSASLGAGTVQLNGAASTPATLDITGTTAISNRIDLSGDPVLSIDNGTTTVAGAIADGSSPGDLVKQGAGNLVLTGANTYTGPTSLNAGTLEIDGSIQSSVSVAQATALLGKGTVAGAVNNAGTVIPGTRTTTGILTVSGNYTQSATGVLAIRTTPTNVAGTGFDQLNIGGSATLAGVLAIDNVGAAEYPLGQPFDLLHAVGGVSGTFSTVNYGGTAFGSDIEPDVLYDNNDVYLQFQSASARTFNTPTGTTQTSADNFANGSVPGTLTKQGQGTLVLTGSSTYTGPTTVEAGTLQVNGSIVSPVTVNSGATLSGNGSVASVNNSGTVAAGTVTAAGILTTTGNYLQSASGTLMSRIGFSGVMGGASSQLKVAGTASLSGTLNIDNTAGAYQVGQSIDLLHSSAGVSGAFSQVDYTGLPFADYLAPSLKYAGNDVYLVLDPQPSVVASGRVHVANSFIQDQSLFTVLESTLTEGDPFAVEGVTPKHDSWVHLLGSDGNANGYAAQSEGVVAGQGVALTEALTLGGAVASLSTTTSDPLASVAGTTVGISGYALYDHGNAAGSIGIGAGHLDNQLTRSLPEFNAAARGDDNGAYAFAGLRAQYRLTTGTVFAIPDISLEYLHTDVAGMADAGAEQLDLHYARLHSDLGRVAAGVTGGFKLNRTYGTVMPWLRVGTNDRIGAHSVTNTETVGLYDSTQSAVAVPTAGFTMGAGADLIGNTAWRVSTRWTGDYGSGTRLENFALTANYVW